MQWWRLKTGISIMNDDGGGVSDLIGKLRHVIYDYKLRVPGNIFVILTFSRVFDRLSFDPTHTKILPIYTMGYKTKFNKILKENKKIIGD